MILKLIIGLGAAFALYRIFRTRKLIPSIISAGMITGIAFVMFPSEFMLTTGLLIYLAFVILAFLYGLFIKGLTLWPRVIICIMSACIFAFWFWRLNHLHGNEMLLPVLSLLIGAAALLSKAKLKNEAGFLVILAADAVAIIVEHLVKIS